MAKVFADRVCVSCSDKNASVTTDFDGVVNADQPYDGAENLEGVYIMGRQCKDDKVFPLVVPRGAEDVSYNATRALMVTIKVDDSLKTNKINEYEGGMEFDLSFDMADNNTGKSDSLVAFVHYDPAMDIRSVRVVLRYPRKDDQVVDKSAIWTTVMHKKIHIKKFGDGDTVAVVIATRNTTGYSAAIDDVKLEWKWQGFN